MTTKFTLLFIGDSAFTQGTVREALRETEYDLMFAPGLKDALMLLPEVKPDLVLLNKLVQRTDGLEILKRMRECRAIPSIPVIFLTNWEAHVDDALRAGADDYIVLPFSNLQLRHRVTSVLRQRGVDAEFQREDRGEHLGASDSSEYLDLDDAEQSLRRLDTVSA